MQKGADRRIEPSNSSLMPMTSPDHVYSKKIIILEKLLYNEPNKWDKLGIFGIISFLNLSWENIGYGIKKNCCIYIYIYISLYFNFNNFLNLGIFHKEFSKYYLK